MYEPNIPTKRFSIPFAKEKVLGALLEAYKQEVMKRGAAYSDSLELIQRLESVSEWLTNAQRKPWIVLYGPTPGTGKTTIARAIIGAMQILRDLDTAEEVREEAEIKKKYGLDQEPYFSSRQEYLQFREQHPKTKEQEENERKSWEEERKVRHKHEELRGQIPAISFAYAHSIASVLLNNNVDSLCLLEGCKTRHYLAIDDLGTEPVTVNLFGNRIMPLTDILLTRYNSMLPTIITTNLSDQALAETYGARIADRLNEVADKIYFSGTSYRR